MFRLKTSAIIIHIAGWLIFISFPILFFSTRPVNEHIFSISVLSYYLLFYCSYIFLFYFNSEFLIPQLYLQKKYLLYSVIILLLLIVFYFIKPFDQLLSHAMSPPRMMRFHAGQMPEGFSPPPGPGFGTEGGLTEGGVVQGPVPGRPAMTFHIFRPPDRIDVVSIFLFIMIVALGMAVKISQRLRTTEQRVMQAEADKANAELSFLKAQVNPHFLFNTLNNIYTLAVTHSEHTASSIMKLSNIMRYVTDDIGEDFVSLQSEVDCISDYIELQRLRLGKNTLLDFMVTGNMEHRKIAPLILMAFIENVFKYGISNREPSTITIKLFSEHQTISFFCQNKIFPVNEKTERTGIGIANTRQRLEHLYPGTHFLNISTEDGLYTVRLTVQI